MTLVSLLTGCAAKNDNWAVIRDPATLNGKPVVVEGTVKVLQVSQTGKRFTVFDVCDPGCIKIFSGGNPRVIDGDRRVVHGTVRPWVGGPANTYLVVADPESL
ncbi:MAG: hypothetical protein M3Z37_04800 [Candidatus Eremiobacteraeota bacterium]|nr:hypothetical protein [Candidatus Eremiobacteraeota bacterium]